MCVLCVLCLCIAAIRDRVSHASWDEFSRLLSGTPPLNGEELLLRAIPLLHPTIAPFQGLIFRLL